MNSDAARTKGAESALRKDRHSLEANHVFWSTRGVHLARRDHAGDPAVQIAVDPAELVLTRRPVTGHWMHMAIDQSGGERGAFRVNYRSTFAVDVFLSADRSNLAVDGQDRIRVEDGVIEIAAEKQPDIADYEARRRFLCGRGILSHSR